MLQPKRADASVMPIKPIAPLRPIKPYASASSVSLSEACFAFALFLLNLADSFFMPIKPILPIRPIKPYASASSASLSEACAFLGFICGKNSTSCMAILPVISIVRRSIPMPIPLVGGMPYCSARKKS